MAFAAQGLLYANRVAKIFISSFDYWGTMP
jgi:hypothetical protein